MPFRKDPVGAKVVRRQGFTGKLLLVIWTTQKPAYFTSAVRLVSSLLKNNTGLNMFSIAIVEKTNFSEYLKALTLPTDVLYEGPSQNIPTTVECLSDEELNQSGYSPRRKSRKVFHSAPVSPPQPSRLGGIELLLAASGKYGIRHG